MTYSRNNLDELTVKITVELDKSDLSKAVEKAEFELGKNIAIEGFRPGKAPKDILRKNLNPETVRQEALQIAVNDSVLEVAKKENLDIYDQKDFKISENSAEKLVYSIVLLLYPKITLGNYKNLEIKQNIPSVEDKEVEKVIQDVLRSRASLVRVERGASKGDQVEIDFEISKNGKPLEGGTSKNHPLIIGENALDPKFEEQLAGMRNGETKQFPLSVKGDTSDVKVVMNTVFERKNPELSDDFAKSLGNFASLDQLKNEIRNNLLEEKKEKEKEKIRLELVKKIVDGSSISFPKDMVESQLDVLMANFDSELHMNGMEIGPYLAHLNKTQESLRNDWRPRAKEQIKMQLALHAIARAENIRVTEDELQSAVEENLQGQVVRSGGQANAADLDIEKIRRNISAFLLNQKVFNFIEKNSRII